MGESPPRNSRLITRIGNFRRSLKTMFVLLNYLNTAAIITIMIVRIFAYDRDSILERPQQRTI